MRFPTALPDVDALTLFEERLVSIYQPFAYICEAPQRQYPVQKGNMVLVQSNIAAVRENLSLPRMWDEQSVLPTQFKRDLKLERAWKCGDTRPYYVVRALDALMEQPLYVDSRIDRREDWGRGWEGGMEEQSEFLEEAPAVRVSFEIGPGCDADVRVRICLNEDFMHETCSGDGGMIHALPNSAPGTIGVDGKCFSR
jgi:hypothetical protein